MLRNFLSIRLNLLRLYSDSMHIKELVFSQFQRTYWSFPGWYLPMVVYIISLLLDSVKWCDNNIRFCIGKIRQKSF